MKNIENKNSKICILENTETIYTFFNYFFPEI